MCIVEQACLKGQTYAYRNQYLLTDLRDTIYFFLVLIADPRRQDH